MKTVQALSWNQEKLRTQNDKHQQLQLLFTPCNDNLVAVVLLYLCQQQLYSHTYTQTLPDLVSDLVVRYA